jgi:hypothetical protein
MVSVYKIGSNILRSAGGGGIWRPPDSAPVVFDFYISTTGTGTAAGGGSFADPWAITMLSNSTARARYAGLNVGLMDGSYNLHTAMNSQAQYTALLNIEGGSSGSPTVVAAVNDRQAIINGKSGSTYGGLTTANDGNVMIGQTAGVTQGYVTLRGLKITGVKTCPVRFGILDYSGGASYSPGITIEDCEIYDCSALTGLDAGGNLGAMSLNNLTGAVVTNNYIHDIVGYVADEANHLQGVIDWNCRNTTRTYNTIVRSGIPIYGKVDGNYGGVIAYNYLDSSNNSDWAAGVLDAAGTVAAVVGGSVLNIHHNVIISMEALALHRGGTVMRMMTETLRIYNNTLILAGGAANPAAFAFWSVYSPGADFWNNLCSNLKPDGSTKSLVAFTTGDAYGGLCTAAGPPALIDYNAYPTGLNRWCTFVNGASNYPSTSYSSLAAWRTANAGSTGAEANSGFINDPLWANTGNYAERYKLQEGSSAKLAGSTDGTVSGSPTDLGAYGNANTRVGCDFATE